MPFPKTERAVYEKNPLEQVICQVRFPPVLKIDASIPADFQERVRHEFPLYTETPEVRLALPSGLENGIPPEIVNQMRQAQAEKNYEFVSEDGTWKINLTRTFIALSTTRYVRWEQFKDKLMLPIGALNQIYAPGYFTRVGLRYMNVIRRSTLGLDDARWDELLQPYALGLLAAPTIGTRIPSFESRHDVALADDLSFVRIAMRLAQAVDNGEECFSIDNDFFCAMRLDTSTAITKLDYFGLRGSRLFRWCITEQLHEALNPMTI